MREVYEVDRTHHEARYLIVDNLYNQVSDKIHIGHIIGSAADHTCERTDDESHDGTQHTASTRHT